MASNAQSRRSRREQLAEQKLAQAKKERRNRLLLTVAGIVVVALVIGLVIWGVAGTRQGGGTDVPPNANSAENGILLAPATDGAPLLEIFSDYNCSACKAADLTLHDVLLEAATTGKATVVVHSLAFEADTSRDAAIAAACSDFVGKFPDFYHQMYLNQADGFDESVLSTTMPDKVGIYGDDLVTYQTCYAAKSTGSFVDDEISYATKEKIASTPSFRLDGKDVYSDILNKNTGTFDPDNLRALLGM